MPRLQRGGSVEIHGGNKAAKSEASGINISSPERGTQTRGSCRVCDPAVSRAVLPSIPLNSIIVPVQFRKVLAGVLA